MLGIFWPFISQASCLKLFIQFPFFGHDALLLFLQLLLNSTVERPGVGGYFPTNNDPKQIAARKTFQLSKTKPNQAATLGDTLTKRTTLETRRNHQHSI